MLRILCHSIAALFLSLYLEDMRLVGKMYPKKREASSLPFSVCLCLLQVNGVNIEGMRHAEVVAFIKKGGDETWLLVVDPDTDEHFKRNGIVPSVSHIKGRTAMLER